MAGTARCAFAPPYDSGSCAQHPGGRTHVRTTSRREEHRAAAPQPLTQDWIDQRIFDLYDEYCHGQIDRREFLARASLALAGLAMAQALSRATRRRRRSRSPMSASRRAM